MADTFALSTFGSLSGEHKYSIACISILKAETLAVTADESGLVCLWDLVKRRCLDKLQLGLQVLSLNTFFRRRDGLYILLIQMRNGKIIKYGIRNNKIVDLQEDSYSCAEYTFCRMQLYNDCLAVHGIGEHSLKIIGMQSDKVLIDGIKIPETSGAIMAMALYSTYLCCGCEDGQVFVFKLDYEINEALLTSSFKILDGSIIGMCQVDEFIFICGAVNFICKFDLSTGKVTTSESTGSNGMAMVCQIKEQVLAATWDGKIRVFDRDSLKLLATITDSVFDSLNCMSVANLPIGIPGAKMTSSVNCLLVTGSKDGLIKLWSV